VNQFEIRDKSSGSIACIGQTATSVLLKLFEDGIMEDATLILQHSDLATFIWGWHI